MKRVFLATLLIAAPGGMDATARERPGTADNPWQLPDTIVVIANRRPTPVRELASSVTVITERQIRENPAQMVAGVLRTVPGLDVVQSGGPGRTVSVFLRGGNSHHTLVLVDGVEMNDPSAPNGSFDFAHLDVGNLERIEVLRGSQSVLYGSDAIGGVIQLFTKRGSASRQLELSAEAGAYGTYRESARLSGSGGPIGYSLSLSRLDSRGFSAASVRSGGVENDGYRNMEFSGRLGVNLPQRFELSLSTRVINGMADIDQSFGVLDDPNATNATTTGNLSVTLSRRRDESFWTPQVGVYVLGQEFESFDATDTDHPDDAGEYHARGRRVKLATQHSLQLASAHTLTLGAEAEEERYRSELLSLSVFGAYADTVAPVDARIASLYALEEYAFGNRLFGTLGVRYDYHEEFEDVVTYRATAAYIPNRFGLKFRGSIGSGFKSPSLFQLYHQFYGNAALQPEGSTSWELGVEDSFARTGLSAGLTVFRTAFRDLIALDPATSRPVNIGEASSRGVELFGAWASGETRIRIDYTRTDTRNESDDTPITRRPRNKLSANVSHDAGDRVRLSLQVLHVGTRLDLDYRAFPAALVTLGDYTLVNPAVTVDVISGLQLRGRVYNLLNERYEEVFTYGTSARAAYVGARIVL